MDPVLSRYDGVFDNPYDTTTPAGFCSDPSVCGDRTELAFNAFITDLGWPSTANRPHTPSAYGAEVPTNISCPAQPGTLLFDDNMSALQDFGLRSSPASTNRKKRKYSSVGDLDLMQPPCVRPHLSLDTESSDDSEARRTAATPLLAAAHIPASPNLQIQTTPLKRSLSAGGIACTLTPFSLVKGTPHQESISLTEVNKRIQAYADADGVSTPQSSPNYGLPAFQSMGRIRVRSVDNCQEDPVFMRPANRSPADF